VLRVRTPTFVSGKTLRPLDGLKRGLRLRGCGACLRSELVDEENPAIEFDDPNDPKYSGKARSYVVPMVILSAAAIGALFLFRGDLGVNPGAHARRC